MKLQLTNKENDFYTYDIIDKEVIGAVEITKFVDHLFIDNIHLYEKFRGKGFLRQTIKSISDLMSTNKLDIVCLPLPCHINKFIHLGFKLYKTINEDNYYILKKV